MVEGAAVVDINEYKAFIKETYIDPIRTVVVIDDEFPSLDGLILQQLTKEKKEDKEPEWADEDIERVSEILAVCRNDSHKWLLDVHDAKNISPYEEEGFAIHFHQSDLIILDYNLDGDDDEGRKAIGILRKLMLNDYFNMVIVYTKGDKDTGGTIDRAIHQIALGLSSPNPKLEMHQKKHEYVSSIIKEWEDYTPDIEKRLVDAIDVRTYLRFSNQNGLTFEAIKGMVEFAELVTNMETKPAEIKLDNESLFQWVICQKQRSFSDRMNEGEPQHVVFDILSEEINWIRSEKLFITVVSKQFDPPKLADKLIDALYEWRPHPLRLIMSKMRAELDERGVLAESRVLSNRFLETGWLKELHTDDADERLWKIKSSIKRHWEALGGAIQPNVEGFAGKLVEYLAKKKFMDIIGEFNLEDPIACDVDIKKELNAYICSKPIEGSHLTTGHVLEIEKSGSLEYWLVMTPACDLVPGQNTDRGWQGRLGGNMTFKVVRLHQLLDEKIALRNSTKSDYVFLSINGPIRAFSFMYIDEKNADKAINSNPSWEQMFARNKGVFIGDNHLVLPVGRVDSNKTLGLQIKYTDARVVAQLRYEYALNLLQRLGVSLSRVGLDFQNMDKEEINKDGKADA